MLSMEDILAVLKVLIDIRNGNGQVDDIDHLGNRRIRCVGEMTENVFRIGLVRSSARSGAAEPGRIEGIDPTWTRSTPAGRRRHQGILRFFATVAVHGPEQPLVRGHPQTPGVGVGAWWPDPRTAGFEVRDVHATHYGRVCPIAKPRKARISV